MALDGDWINAGGGANGKINPLQIRPTQSMKMINIIRMKAMVWAIWPYT